MNGRMKNEGGKEETTLLKPAEIVRRLDEHVIGQEEAKKTLAVAAYNHYKRIRFATQSRGLEIQKSNVAILGSTGCGKTYIVETLARMLDVPCFIQDCSKLTASGYTGSDVESCLTGLLMACNYDVRRAERGIVVLDECDKIAAHDVGPGHTKDVGGECVQQSLLKIVEGDVVGVPPMGGRKHPEQELIYVNTKNILFVMSGAFVGLEKIIASRTGHDQCRIGFRSDHSGLTSDCLLEYVTSEDLRKYGMIPEFVGRFPITTYVQPLGRAELDRILTEPRNSLCEQYKALLGMDSVKLSFTKEATAEIARIAATLGTGARGLRSIVEKVMRDIMFTAPSESNDRRCVVVDRDLVIAKTASQTSMAV